jgi:hypothetical protein
MLKIVKNPNPTDYYRSVDEYENSEIKDFLLKRRHDIILFWSVLVSVMIGSVIVWNLLINAAVNERIKQLTASGAIHWVKPK